VVNVLIEDSLNYDRNGEVYEVVSNILSFSGQNFARHSPSCGVAVNTLNSHHCHGSVGLLHCHRPVFPLQIGLRLCDDDWTFADWCDQCHRKKGLTVWTKPQRTGAHFDYGEPLADLILGKIDAFEILPYSAVPVCEWPEDYYRLLDAELFVPLVGSSAKRSNSHLLGELRTYAHVPAEQEFTYAAWIEAVRAGRTYVSNGPLLSLTINDLLPTHELMLAASENALKVRVEAKSWRPFEAVELLWCGTPIAAAKPVSTSPFQAVLELDLAIEESGWLAVRCHGWDVFAHSSVVVLRRSQAPDWAAPKAINRILDELDKMLNWAKEKARCTTPDRRIRLCRVFEEARTILAKKLSH
jgi:hypothetical protein